MFLRGCREPLEQYRECLMKNLKDWHGRGLVRQKLSAVKIHQLGQMNITRFDHQKLIMDRIRHLSDIPSMARYSVGKANVAEVEAAVHVAPRRKGSSSNTGSSNNVNRVLSGDSVSSGSLAENASQSDASMSEDTGEGGKKSKGHHRRRSTRHGLGVKGGRRGSLAIDKTWEAINKSRAEADGGVKQKQLDTIRRRISNVGTQPPELKPFNPAEFAREQNQASSNDSSLVGSKESSDTNGASKGAGRRESLSPNVHDKARQARIDEAKAKRQRALEYGNSALKATTREGQLKDLKKQILADFVSTIGCDRATLMFVDTPAQELFFFDGNMRIAFPLRKGIAGHVAATGMGLVVNDPYNNERFNRQVDKDSGFVTRNILCEPIKSRKGGNVVAVLQMVNKKDGEDFSEHDAGVMEMCAVKVALALDTSFAALVSAENEWAKAAGRRRSSGSGSRRDSSIDDGESVPTAAEAAAAAASATAAVAAQRRSDDADATAGGGRRGSLGGRRGSATLSGLGDDGLQEVPQISNRRGSGTSKADVEKLKRRTEYGKEPSLIPLFDATPLSPDFTQGSR
ncbi:similar to camp and camp-inhibited cgmp 3,5-cyclic phosphodiesterase [Ectocarpus siliculosus]|uniref:Similar to camp and camp-inhibited cgmp 3,5-cyclic phosphodiesterase n=1 Tax=Ectocarpus siliculosus TaxID=2880 RepID=D7G3E1_ECTSI|nr:similar to camp and camp-inhibited cgmp 3,5-cyclic phosphodiesterase [Ectocarpus siliculosus]|eukprot:CBJ33535.1 similar to camp and camp-inhibited cgmp 3,5-cyclic phosphodiesterase [Ectocarpus siliculosus]